MTEAPLIGKTRRLARGRKLAARKLLGEIASLEETRKSAEMKGDKDMLIALAVGGGAVYRRIPETLKGLDPACDEAKTLQACLDDWNTKVKAVLAAEKAGFSKLATEGASGLKACADAVRAGLLKS